MCRWIQHLLHYNAVKAFLFLIVGDTNIKQSFNVIVNNITFPLTHLKSINPRIYPYQRDRYMAYFLEVSSVSGIDWANIRWKNYYYWETIASPTNFGDIQSIYRNFNKPIYTKNNLELPILAKFYYVLEWKTCIYNTFRVKDVDEGRVTTDITTPNG